MVDPAAAVTAGAGADGQIDFFISRRGAHAATAREVAEVLAEDGYTSFTQDIDIGYGDDFLAKMDHALQRCRHFVVLLTSDYQTSKYTMMELTSFMAATDSDPSRRLMVLRIEDCTPKGILAARNYIDLVGVNDPEERKARIRGIVVGKAGLGPSRQKLFENVPPHDLRFTGRDELLAEIHGQLMGSGRSAQVAIHGLGGLGKTALASEYAHRYRDDYAGVWWAPAESRTLLIASLAELASRLDRDLSHEPDLERAAKAGLVRLARPGPPFLLVYDNVDAPETVQGLTPSAGTRVLTTTRWVDWSGRAAEVKLGPLRLDAAIELLQSRAGRTDATNAARLAEALGRLPLALDHAGAYCRLAGTSFEAYRSRLDTRIARAPKGAAYPASIAATFALAIERASAQHKTAETLLGFFAYLGPERIPLHLLSADVPDEDEQAEALMALAAVSLIEHEAIEDTPAVTLHRLVQAAMRAALTERGTAASTIARVTLRLAEAFPKDAWEPTLWASAAVLLPHVLALCEYIVHEPMAAEAGGRLLGAAGNYLRGRAAYAEAEPLLREALSISESALGSDHPDMSRRNNDLGLMLWTTGRHAEAEPFFRSAITKAENTQGREHPDVAGALNNLARLLNDTGRREEAEPLFREAIAIGEKTLGRRHATVVPWLNNLAILLNESGRNAEAQPLYREAIAIGEATLGRDHSEVARSYNNLARSLRDTGDFAEAEINARQAIAIWRRVVGSEHPLLGRWQENLAQIMLKMDRRDEALTEAEAALASHEKALGAQHRWTQDSARTCAEALDALARTDDAGALRQRYGL
jgi:tetratricopeptide (TPR) repeat protein